MYAHNYIISGRLDINEVIRAISRATDQVIEPEEVKVSQRNGDVTFPSFPVSQFPSFPVSQFPCFPVSQFPSFPMTE